MMNLIISLIVVLLLLVVFVFNKKSQKDWEAKYGKKVVDKKEESKLKEEGVIWNVVYDPVLVFINVNTNKDEFSFNDRRYTIVKRIVRNKVTYKYALNGHVFGEFNHTLSLARMIVLANR